MNMDIVMDMELLSAWGAAALTMNMIYGSDPERHELFDELDAADPHWQKRHRTLRHAALAYGLAAEFTDFLTTPQGRRYLDAMTGVRDWEAENERARRQREAEIEMANRSAK